MTIAAGHCVRALAAVLCLLVSGAIANRASAQPAPGAANASAQAVARPDNIRSWVTLGTTLRMSRDNPNTPDEMRHVQMEPGAYARLLESGAYPDGAAFTVTFY